MNTCNKDQTNGMTIYLKIVRSPYVRIVIARFKILKMINV